MLVKVDFFAFDGRYIATREVKWYPDPKNPENPHHNFLFTMKKSAEDFVHCHAVAVNNPEGIPLMLPAGSRNIVRQFVSEKTPPVAIPIHLPAHREWPLAAA